MSAFLLFIMISPCAASSLVEGWGWGGDDAACGGTIAKGGSRFTAG